MLISLFNGFLLNSSGAGVILSFSGQRIIIIIERNSILFKAGLPEDE
jgi:hypothetical protein